MKAPAEIRSLKKPLLISHNKYCNEWQIRPVNNSSVKALLTIFSTLKNRYSIIDIRHGISKKALVSGCSLDSNNLLGYDDRALFAKHPEVQCFDDLYNSHQHPNAYDINTYKNILDSRCFYFITSQGGGAHHIAFFRVSLVIVKHTK